MNKVISREYVEKNYIHKDKIKEIFKRINNCKINTEGRINAINYMIFGETDRATGWFINLDYIEKILLNKAGYHIGDETIEEETKDEQIQK